MPKAVSFLGGALSSFGDQALAHQAQKHQDEIQERRDAMSAWSVVMNSPDASAADKQLALDNYWHLANGGKPGTKPKDTTAAPGDQAKKVLGKLVFSPPPDRPGTDPSQGTGSEPGGDALPVPGGEQTPDVAATLPPLPGKPNAPANVSRAQGGPQVPSKLPDFPQLEWTGRKEQDARDLAKFQGEEDIRSAAQLKLEQQRYEHETQLKKMGMVPTTSYQQGENIATNPDGSPQQDLEGNPIQKGARYRVWKMGDGGWAFMRDDAKAAAPSTQDKAIQATAANMKALDVSKGLTPKSDDQYVQLARVEARVNEVAKTRERASRYNQFLKTSNQAVALSEARTDLDRERLSQLQQEFPLTMAAKQLGIDTASAKLDLTGTPNPTTLMEWATDTATKLIANKNSPYYGADLLPTRDAMLTEMGQDPVDLQAQIKARQAPKDKGKTAVAPGEVTKPAQRNPDVDAADIRTKARAILAGANKDSSDASIDTFLSKPANLANVKAAIGKK